MALRWPDKDPDELLDYTVDWSRYLDTLTIASVEWRYILTNTLGAKSKGDESLALSASSNLDATDSEANPANGLIVNSIPTPTNTTASIVLQGGVANKDYTLICEITTSTSAKTSAAIVTKRLINLRVRERN